MCEVFFIDTNNLEYILIQTTYATTCHLFSIKEIDFIPLAYSFLIPSLNDYFSQEIVVANG